MERNTFIIIVIALVVVVLGWAWFSQNNVIPSPILSSNSARFQAADSVQIPGERYIASDDSLAPITGLAGGSSSVTNFYDNNLSTIPIGKIYVSATDVNLGFLLGKLVAGNGIVLTQNYLGGNESITISSTATSVVWGNITGSLSNQSDLWNYLIDQNGFFVKWQDANNSFQPIGNYLTNIPSYVLEDGNNISRLVNDSNYLKGQDAFVYFQTKGNYLTDVNLIGYLKSVDANSLFAFRVDVNSWGDARYLPISTSFVDTNTQTARWTNVSGKWLSDFNVGGNVYVDGNVTATFYKGNGSLLTGISSGWISKATSDLNMATHNVSDVNNLYLKVVWADVNKSYGTMYCPDGNIIIGYLVGYSC